MPTSATWSDGQTRPFLVEAPNHSVSVPASQKLGRKWSQPLTSGGHPHTHCLSVRQPSRRLYSHFELSYGRSEGGRDFQRTTCARKKPTWGRQEQRSPVLGQRYPPEPQRTSTKTRASTWPECSPKTQTRRQQGNAKKQASIYFYLTYKNVSELLPFALPLLPSTLHLLDLNHASPSPLDHVHIDYLPLHGTLTGNLNILRRGSSKPTSPALHPLPSCCVLRKCKPNIKITRAKQKRRLALRPCWANDFLSLHLRLSICRRRRLDLTDCKEVPLALTSEGLAGWTSQTLPVSGTPSNLEAGYWGSTVFYHWQPIPKDPGPLGGKNTGNQDTWMSTSLLRYFGKGTEWVGEVIRADLSSVRVF